MKKVFALLAIVVIVGLTAPTSADEKKKLGHTSGHAAGTHVEPSTATQKRNPHLEDLDDARGLAAGAPGVEGSRGTQSGRHHRSPRRQ